MTASELISARREQEAKERAKQLWQDHNLDENTCWMYQLELEALINRYLTDSRMSGRFLTMLRLLATQARKASNE